MHLYSISVECVNACTRLLFVCVCVIDLLDTSGSIIDKVNNATYPSPPLSPVLAQQK